MKRRFAVLDTFAGAGGFSLGFELAGCKIVGAIEKDKWACETFAYNHKHAIVVQSDITGLSDAFLLKTFSRKRPEIILGGPPCQGFSICNRNNNDPKDPRNSLFEQFIRLGRLFKPLVMVMENVPNLMNAKTLSGDPVISIIHKELQALDYFVYSKVLEATDYGIPQIRKRLFVVASKKELDHPFPLPTHTVAMPKADIFGKSLLKCPLLWDAISDLPDIEANEGDEKVEYDRLFQNTYQQLLRMKSKQVFNHKAMRHSRRVVERFASMKWGDSTSDVPVHLKPLKRNGHGIISEKVYDQNNRRMHPDRPCHTIAASFYANFVHPYKNRNFTAREGARIQSFPDNYIFLGKPTVVSHKLLEREGRVHEKYLCQYSQIGNAVPPLLARALASNLLSRL